MPKKKKASTKAPQIAPQIVKGPKAKGPKANAPITSSKKLAKMTKKAAKKAIVNKIKEHYKVTVNTGMNPAQIGVAINETIHVQNFVSATGQDSKTIRDLLLPRLYGLKSTKVVREILETPAPPSTVQGPALYGCGGTGLPIVGSTSSWFFPEGLKQDMRDSGLVYCWMSLVACTFRQGANSYCGLGINHEMEHAIACAGQVLANLLAQSPNLGPDKEHRKHHVILFEVMKQLLNGVDEQMVKRYVYLIMRMIRRQQVIVGLPSISVVNQEKCQKNLIMMQVDPTTLKVRLLTNESIANEIMDHVGSAVAKGMTVKPGKVSFSPCGWCGVDNAQSAFAAAGRLTQLYSTGYVTAGGPDNVKIQRAVVSAQTFKSKTKEQKRDTIKKQCKKLCDKYNEMSEAEIVKGEQKEDLSRFIISASIIVLSVIIKSTYTDLGVYTIHMPELFKWVNKAKETLSNATELDRLFGLKADGKAQDGAVWVINKSQELAEESDNAVTTRYLNCTDNTIRGFYNLSQGGGGEEGGEEGGLDIELEPGGNSGDQSRLPTTPLPSSPPFTPVSEFEKEGKMIQRTSQANLGWSPTAAGAAGAAGAARSDLDFEALKTEIENCFMYRDSEYPSDTPDPKYEDDIDTIITLMFDKFGVSDSELNPDFISAVELNIDNLPDFELIKLYDATFNKRLVILPESEDESGLARTNTMDALRAEFGDPTQTPEDVEVEDESGLARTNTMDALRAEFGDPTQTPEDVEVESEVERPGYGMTPLGSQSEDDMTDSQSEDDMTDSQSDYSQTESDYSQTESEDEGVLGTGPFSSVSLGNSVFARRPRSQRQRYNPYAPSGPFSSFGQAMKKKGIETETENEDDVFDRQMEMNRGGGAHNRPFGFGSGKKKSKKTKRKSNKKNTKRKTKRKSNKKNTKRKSNKKNTKRKTNKKNTKSK